MIYHGLLLAIKIYNRENKSNYFVSQNYFYIKTFKNNQLNKNDITWVYNFNPWSLELLSWCVDQTYQKSMVLPLG